MTIVISIAIICFVVIFSAMADGTEVGEFFEDVAESLQDFLEAIGDE